MRIMCNVELMRGRWWRTAEFTATNWTPNSDSFQAPTTLDKYMVKICGRVKLDTNTLDYYVLFYGVPYQDFEDTTTCRLQLIKGHKVVHTGHTVRKHLGDLYQAYGVFDVQGADKLCHYVYGDTWAVTIRLVMRKRDEWFASGEYDDRHKLPATMLIDPMDMLLMDVRGHTISVAKEVLKKKSPVFLAMLESGMRENSSNRVHIKDVTFEAMRMFIRFLYFGKIKFESVKMAMDMIYVADKYQVECLVEFSADYLLHNVDMDNVHAIINLAERHSLTNLQLEAIDYVTVTHDCYTSI